MRDGPDAAQQLIKSAIGGVLFIDEAYLLMPSRIESGKIILGQLLAAAENHRVRMRGALSRGTCAERAVQLFVGRRLQLARLVG